MTVDVTTFRGALPYRSLTDSDWGVLAGVLQLVEIAPGGTVFREGDSGDGFYLVRSGHVRIFRRVVLEGRSGTQEQLLAALDAGHLFGEMAMIEGEPRSAEAASDEGAVLYHLNGTTFGQIKSQHPDMALRLQDLLLATLCGRLRAANKNFENIKHWSETRRWVPETRNSTDVDLSVFRDAKTYRALTESDWAVLSKMLRRFKASPGVPVFREGDPGDGFYMVRSGHVKILRRVALDGRPGVQEQLLTVLDSGQLFGEMALIEGDRRSAEAVSDEGSVLYHLSGEAFDRIKKRSPGTALRIQDLLVTTLCSRLRAANKNFEIIKFWLA
jgi:CRP-like cAMP-binding protein